MHFDVVIVGFRLNAKEPAAKALERILGLNAETARRLARNFPATVRSHLTADKAEDLRELLAEAGALVELHAEKPAAPAKKPAALEQTPAPGRRSQATSPQSTDKISLDLAPERAPRAKQQTEGTKGAPPPPPAAALYQLGDFGLAGVRAGGASMRPSAPLHVPPPPAATPGLAGLPAQVNNSMAPRTAAARRASITGGMELDLDMANAPLELDTAVDPYAGRASRTGSQRNGSAPEDLHSLGERFSDANVPSGRGPQVEERAFKSIQRSSRNSLRPSRRPPKKSVFQHVRDWTPSVLMLVVMCAFSLAAVGYALEPDDALGAMVREQYTALASPAARASAGDDGNLHPLLRMTPLATRGPLSVILRSRISGVHEVEVIYKGRPGNFHCAVVEQAEGQTETRMAQVRATGREVSFPGEVAAQLGLAEANLRVETKQPGLQFQRICLTL